MTDEEKQKAVNGARKWLKEYRDENGASIRELRDSRGDGAIKSIDECADMTVIDVMYALTHPVTVH